MKDSLSLVKILSWKCDGLLDNLSESVVLEGVVKEVLM